MKVKLFGENVLVKSKDCSLNGAEGLALDPYFNLYVRLSNICNASCGFCEYHHEDTVTFNVHKFMQVLEEIKSVAKISKISFTGGEPTIHRPLLESLLYNVRSLDSSIFTVLSTNGYDIEDFPMDLLDSMAISRHHYREDINASIFKSPLNKRRTLEELLPQLNTRNKIHLSCTTMRDAIGSSEEVYNYLETFAEMGVSDFGFVTLMPVNKYATEQRVDAEVIVQNAENTQIQRVYKKGLDCRCKNFETTTKYGTVWSYARSNLSPSKCESLLVYDMNSLREGFNGRVIF